MSILKDVKNIVNDVYDSNGNLRTIPIGFVGDRRLPTSRLRLLQSFLDLLKNTNIITDETKLYIFNKYISIKGVVEEAQSLKNGGGESVKYNTVQSKIYYDKNKLERDFGENFIADILMRSDNEDKMSEYTAKITSAYIKFSGNKDNDIRNNLCLDLDRGCICTELEDAKFDSFVKTIMPYLKSHIDTITRGIDKESIGYFNFLLSSPLLNEVDQKRADFIKQILNPIENIEDAFDL